jgi:hypothetical protein
MSESEQLVLRNPARWFVAVVYWLGAAVFIAESLIQQESIWTVVAVIVSICSLVLGVRSARAAIWIDDAGVKATGDRFTRSLKWDEIDRFELRAGGPRGVLPRSGLGLWTVEGRWVRLMDRALGVTGEFETALNVLQTEAIRHRETTA